MNEENGDAQENHTINQFFYMNRKVIPYLLFTLKSGWKKQYLNPYSREPELCKTTGLYRKPTNIISRSEIN